MLVIYVGNDVQIDFIERRMDGPRFAGSVWLLCNRDCIERGYTNRRSDIPWVTLSNLIATTLV